MVKHIINISFLISILTLVSCDNRIIANFEISNETKFKIDSLKIEPTVSLNERFIAINPDATVKYEVDMTEILKTDGSYRLTYIQNGKTLIKNFGYYTNGYPIEDLIKIKVLNDTILFNSKFNNPY